MLKTHLFFDMIETDPSALHLLYIEAARNVMEEEYPCSELDVVTLAALQVQMHYGDFSGNSLVNIAEQLPRFLPPSLMDEEHSDKLEKLISNIHEKFVSRLLSFAFLMMSHRQRRRTGKCHAPSHSPIRSCCPDRLDIRRKTPN